MLRNLKIQDKDLIVVANNIEILSFKILHKMTVFGLQAELKPNSRECGGLQIGLIITRNLVTVLQTD